MKKPHLLATLLTMATLSLGASFSWAQEYTHLVLNDEIPLLRQWPGPDGSPIPFSTMQEIEEFLRSAQVVDSKKISEGIAGAQKLLLEEHGVRMHGIFRDVSIQHSRIVLADGTTRLNFRDDAIFECAAYELSKILGLRYVPMAVQRRINGKRGTLQVWIEDCIMEKDRIRKQGLPPDPRQWMLQQNVMFLFDNLINNTDRHGGNILVTPDWKMILIDHTRSFGNQRKLDQAKRILFCEKDVLLRLKELDKTILKKRLGKFLSPMLVQSVLFRRDLLLRHIDQMIEERGESAVIIDSWQ